MMQEQRTEHEVEAGRSKWQLKRIGHKLRLRCMGQMNALPIHCGDHASRITSAKSCPHITRCRPHIQQGKAVVRTYELAHHSPQDAVSAEVTVDADQVVEIRSRVLWWSMIQHLRLDEPLAGHWHPPMIRCGRQSSLKYRLRKTDTVQSPQRFSPSSIFRHARVIFGGLSPMRDLLPAG